MRVVFIGPPGSGKGTQSALLSQRLGLTVIGTGVLFREARELENSLGKKVKPYLDAGTLVPDEIVNDLIAEKLRGPDGAERFLLDGYPRTPVQASALDAVLADLKLPLSAAVQFVIDDEIAVKRMLGRNRGDDSEETARQRLQLYHETCKPLVSHYRQQRLLHEVQADQPVEVLYALIASKLVSPRR